MDGWIKLHRKLMESESFYKLTAVQKLIAIYIVLNANHEDGIWYDKYKGIEVEVKRGSLVTSRNKIVNEWFNKDKDVTEQRVRTCLDKLVRINFITKSPANDYTLISVVNYDIYQSKKHDDNQAVTKYQPSGNQAITTNKNVENYISTTTAEIEQEEPETLLSTYTKVFKALTMDGLTSDFFMKLRNQGYTERFCIELLLEAGESCQGAKPSLRYMESIRDRWIREKIYTRLESKARKEQSYKVTPLIPNAPKPTVASDEEMRELEEMARRAAERNRASNQ